MCVELRPAEAVTPVKVGLRKISPAAAARRSRQARLAVTARWTRRRSPPTPPCVPSLGPRPPRGTPRHKWEADRARLLECEVSLVDLRQHRDEELGRPWTKETTFNVIETTINLMVLLNISKSAACEMVAKLWRRRKEKVLERLNAWMGNRKVLWTPPRPTGAASPSYPHHCATLDGTHQVWQIPGHKEIN